MKKLLSIIMVLGLVACNSGSTNVKTIPTIKINSTKHTNTSVQKRFLKTTNGRSRFFFALKNGNAPIKKIYGKQVVNAMDLLTTDGSVANNFDFFENNCFESDLEKGAITQKMYDILSYLYSSLFLFSLP